jgi:uncharacterized protein DUF3854
MPIPINRMNRHLEFLLSPLFDNATLHPEHQVDLDKSGISNETRRYHKIRSVPPGMIGPLLGFEPRGVRHALLFPFPDPLRPGEFFDYVKMKVWNADAEPADVRGDQIEESRDRWRYNGGARKYLVCRQSAPHLYIPIPTTRRVLDGDEPLWVCEGMKKALATMQLGLPTVGIESVWGWHVQGSRDLLPDFAVIRLKHRIIELVPDSDAQTNPMIARSMRQFADALRLAGARPRLVRLPAGAKGCDDFIEMMREA